MNPGDRQLSTLWAVKGKAAVPELAKLAPVVRDRKGQHPKDHLARFRGWMHADGYAGFERFYQPTRPGADPPLARRARKKLVPEVRDDKALWQADRWHGCAH